MSNTHINENLQTIRATIRQAELQAGRPAGSVKLMLAVKYQPLENIVTAIAAGETLLGHNLVHQLKNTETELADYRAQLANSHTESTSELSIPLPATYTTMIGHLQSNKLSTAMKYAQRIDTVDSLKLAQSINRRQLASLATGSAQTPYPILLQVNSANSPSQYGCAPAELLDLAQAILELPGVEIQGIMTIGANSPDHNAVASSFQLTQELSLRLQELPTLENANILSMGMTNDLSLAVKYGSTLVRIGTAIFGERQTGNRLKTSS